MSRKRGETWGTRLSPHDLLIQASAVNHSYPLHSSANPQQEVVVQKHICYEGVLSDGLCLDGNGSAFQELASFAVGTGKTRLSNQLVKANHTSSGRTKTLANHLDGVMRFAVRIDLNVSSAHVHRFELFRGLIFLKLLCPILGGF